MKKNKKSKLISVGKDFIGVVGLDEIFQNLFDKSKKPERSLGKKLLSLAKKNNYIPAGVAGVPHSAAVGHPPGQHRCSTAPEHHRQAP